MPKVKNREPLWFLLGATAVSVVLSLIPLARMAVYPIRLFVTFIHEGGHAAAAILTFGQVDRLHVYLDASGTTFTRGGFGPAISSAGYLTSTVFGAGLLILGSQPKRANAALTGCAVLVLLIAFLAGDLGTLAMGIGLALVLVGFAIKASPGLAHFVLSFLAVQCCLNAVLDLQTLFVISTTTNMHSDAANMAQMTLIPAAVWAILWLGLSVIALIFALRSYARHL